MEPETIASLMHIHRDWETESYRIVENINLLSLK